jgi:hypothetical protein
MRAKTLLSHDLNITPVDQPLFPLPLGATIGTWDYLAPCVSDAIPYGSDVAEWLQATFPGQDGLDPCSNVEYRSEPAITPLKPDAATLVAIFYPDDEPEGNKRRSTQNYLARIARLAALGEQTIIYAPPSISQSLRAMRPDDVYWHIIDDYETVWDIPNNRHQRHNFTHVQPRLFDAFDKTSGKVGWEPEPQYNHPHRSAVYNAKAFVAFDAVLRNPFGSKRWIYVDAGIFDEFGPLDSTGTIWGDVLKCKLSTAKLDRTLSMTGDTGVAFAEYRHSLAYGTKDIDHPGWTDPTKSWMIQHFMAQSYVGTSLGMLNYSIRFMATVDEMDANGFYTAREEFVIPHVAIRYPHTIYAIPWMVVLDWGVWDHPIKGCYTTYGGDESVSSLGDPLEQICLGYKGGARGLDGCGAYKWSWGKRMSVYGQRYPSY